MSRENRPVRAIFSIAAGRGRDVSSSWRLSCDGGFTRRAGDVCWPCVVALSNARSIRYGIKERGEQSAIGGLRRSELVMCSVRIVPSICEKIVVI